MERMKINIYSRKSLHTSYSCILYLKKSLEKYGDVVLWSHTPQNDVDDDYKANSYSFFDQWYGKIRGVRIILAKIQCFLEAIRGKQILVIQDLDFIIPAYFAKKFNKKLRIVHYNTEIHGSDVKYPQYIVSFYEKHAEFPDLILECLNERATYRKRKYHIGKKIYVINNTLPMIKDNSPEIELNDEVFLFKEKLPILIYAGGCDKTRGLKVVLDSIRLLEGKVNFIFFLDDSNKHAYDSVVYECKTYIDKGVCNVFPAVKRNILFGYMKQCDIGLNYYDPTLNINHRFASPTKFFEYMANGLKIITTNNEGINKIVKEEGIGACFEVDDDFPDKVIDLISDKTVKTKKEIQKLFLLKYCYEISSQEAIQAIIDLWNDKR